MPLETCTTDEIITSFNNFYFNTQSKENPSVFCNPETGLYFSLRLAGISQQQQKISNDEYSITFRVSSIQQVLDMITKLGATKDNTENIIKKLYKEGVNPTESDRHFYMNLTLRKVSS